MTYKQVFGFDDKKLLLIGIPLASVTIFLLLFHQAFGQEPIVYFLVCFCISILYTSIYWFSLRAFYKHIKCSYPTFGQIQIRLMMTFGAFLVVFAGVKVFDRLIIKQIYYSTHQPGIIIEFTATLLLSCLVISIYEAYFFAHELQRTVTEKTALERDYVQSQLEGLRNQVNPHFLFNSLNTLIYLIPEDQDKAVKFVHQLSKVYRFLLESREAKLIPLEEEMAFLDAYIFLQKERFGENLQVQISALPSLKKTGIIPLTLQLLFENAIKHNIISTEKPLKIDLSVENTHLIVRNNYQPKNRVAIGTGMGLQNIKDRYRLLDNRSVEVIVTPQSFMVALPILQL
jgi:two-component system, LytTR family, sensor kinase